MSKEVISMQGCMCWVYVLWWGKARGHGSPYEADLA